MWAGRLMQQFVCEFCKKICKNLNSLRNHTRLCRLNPNKQESNIKKFKDRNSIPWNKNKTGFTAWNKGKEGTFKGKHHSEKTKTQMSVSRSKLYESGWEPVCGRAKKYSYNSHIAGNIKVDGTWELEVAKYFDFINIEWKRNKNRFRYIKPDGKISTYQPDFIIKDYIYIEVKGYETDIDRAKWSQFNELLIILRKDDIDNIKMGGKPGGAWASLLS